MIGLSKSLAFVGGARLRRSHALAAAASGDAKADWWSAVGVVVWANALFAVVPVVIAGAGLVPPEQGGADLEGAVGLGAAAVSGVAMAVFGVLGFMLYAVLQGWILRKFGGRDLPRAEARATVALAAASVVPLFLVTEVVGVGVELAAAWTVTDPHTAVTVMIGSTVVLGCVNLWLLVEAALTGRWIADAVYHHPVPLWAMVMALIVVPFLVLGALWAVAFAVVMVVQGA